MTAPAVDKAQRLVDNMETFIHTHASELFIMTSVLNEDIDEIIMEMLLEGYGTIRARAQQMTEVSNEGWDRIIEATDKAVEAITKELSE